jgi:hypothetical protein
MADAADATSAASAASSPESVVLPPMAQRIEGGKTYHGAFHSDPYAW